MKKRMRKGSLLITLSLLLAMMMGMSVHATTYTFIEQNVDGLEVGDILRPGDILRCHYSSYIRICIDNESIVEGERKSNESDKYYYIEDELEILRIEFVPHVNGADYCVHVEMHQSAPAPDNGSNSTAVIEEPKETEEQIFTRELLASVASAKAGDNRVIDATVWHSFSAKVLGELFSKEGVEYTLYYNFRGECFYITIPAGAELEEGCEWYGPLKLNAMFGRTMIDESELEAAISE